MITFRLFWSGGTSGLIYTENLWRNNKVETDYRNFQKKYSLFAENKNLKMIDRC